MVTINNEFKMLDLIKFLQFKNATKMRCGRPEQSPTGKCDRIQKCSIDVFARKS